MRDFDCYFQNSRFWTIRASLYKTNLSRALANQFSANYLFIYFLFFANVVYLNVIDHGKINQHILNFQLYLISMLAMYVVYFLYLALRAFGELRAMNFLDARLKFHAASLSLVLVLTISIVAKR